MPLSSTRPATEKRPSGFGSAKRGRPGIAKVRARTSSRLMGLLLPGVTSCELVEIQLQYTAEPLPLDLVHAHGRLVQST